MKFLKRGFFLPGWRHRSSGYMWPLMKAQKYPLPRAEALSCRSSVSRQRVVPSALEALDERRQPTCAHVNS